jgi:hypothetical protein
MQTMECQWDSHEWWDIKSPLSGTQRPQPSDRQLTSKAATWMGLIGMCIVLVWSSRVFVYVSWVKLGYMNFFKLVQ